MKFLNRNTALCLTALLCSSSMFGMEQKSVVDTAAQAAAMTQQSVQKVLFQPKALDPRTQAALAKMRADISAEEDAFWNQSIGTLEKQVGIRKTTKE